MYTMCMSRCVRGGVVWHDADTMLATRCLPFFAQDLVADATTSRISIHPVLLGKGCNVCILL